MRNVIIEKIADELNCEIRGVEQAVKLIDDDNNLHFIARYKKDQTNCLTSEQLRILYKRLIFFRKLEKHKTKVLNKLKELNLISSQLEDAIKAAKTITDLNEIMTPYKTSKKTRANLAREQGLQPLADIILGKNSGNLEKIAQNNSSKSIKEQINQSLDIVAEESINHPTSKRIAERELLHGNLIIKYYEDEDQDDNYINLRNINTKPNYLSPHQVHALFRAENEGVIQLKFKHDSNLIINEIKKQCLYTPPEKYKKYFNKGLKDGVKRLLIPRAKRSVRTLLKKKADLRAIEVFKENLENLLMTPPINPQVILAIDPGYVSGCKIAIINESGILLRTDIIYPTPPKKEINKSETILAKLIDQYQVKFIAIGNGTASTETLQFVKHMFHKDGYAGINFGIVPEDGASVYSASLVAEREFPNLPSELRGAISIGRRVLDPLAEYVKIDPKSLGVGQYQHDIDDKQLENALNFVVEKCVNNVGLNLRTASVEAIQHISGLSHILADRIVNYRIENGFTSLENLYQIKGIGFKTFEQCAGFLKIPQSEILLDNTLIHPDHYYIAEKIIELVGKNIFSWKETNENKRKELLDKLNFDNIMNENLGVELLRDIKFQLIEFGNDPRGKKEFVDLSKAPASINELKLNMILNGEVRNVVDFGAFVDLGIKENGLIHISNLAKRFVSNVNSIVKVGDKVKVKIIELDRSRNRIGLKLIEVNDGPP